MNHEPSPWVRRAILAVAVMPIIAAVVRALSNDWFPIGDNALLYIRVVDVLTEHHPWLGSWTSASLSVGENMNNPGPIYADLVAPFAKLFAPGPGAAIGVGVVNLFTVVGISAAARRIGGWALQQWAILAAAALSWSMGSEMLFDIWQAHALLLPFLLLLVLLLGVTDGQTWCIPWALAVISVLVQTHISFAYILAVLCPVAAVGYHLVRRRRPHLAWRDVWRSRVVLLTALGMFALWAQTLYEQFFGPGKGNLSRLAGNTGGGSLQVGAEKALGITARLFVLPPWWMRSGFSTSVPNTTLTGTPEQPRLELPGLPGAAVSAVLVLGLVGLLVGLVVLHRRRGAHLLAAACVLAVAGVVGSALSVSQLTVGRVGFSSHHVRFLWPIAVFVHVAIGWSVVHLLARSERSQRVATWSLITATALLSVAAVPYHAQPQGPVAFYSAMPALRRVLPELEKLRAVQPVLYDVSQVRIFEPFSSTVMMGLQDLDIEFRVDDEVMVRQLGEGRRADGTEPARIFQVQGSPALLSNNDFCLIALASDLPADEEGVAIEYADQMAAEVASGLIVIDDTVLRDADAAIEPVLRAATAGDYAAAQRIVYEGYLSRWYANGEVHTERDLTANFPVVNRFMDTVYGLFSDQSAPCP